MSYAINPSLGNEILPVDIVLAPEWWHRNAGMTFDRDYFFHPVRRAEEEQRMEKILFERWGKYGMGADKDHKRPEIGAVHLAAGFLLSEMLGCTIHYSDNHPPQVIPAKQDHLTINETEVFRSKAYKETLNLWDQLKQKHGYLTGDINWGGILNLALDLRGEEIFMDMMVSPLETHQYFNRLGEVIDRFTNEMISQTGSSSVSVNRCVRHFKKPVFLHSECSHTMISEEDYANFLLPYDIKWSKNRPFGIHYCGPDPHRMAEQFAKIPHLDFLDLGWGGDVKLLRQHLPNTFLNIRLSPVEIIHQSNQEIRETIIRLVSESGNPFLTGICCINMDDQVSDDKVETIFKTVEELRGHYS